MKRICKGLIVMALIFLISPLAEAEMRGQMLVDGWNDYQNMKLQGWRSSELGGVYMGYVSGICDATSFSFPSGTKNEQVFDLVGKYLDEHLERWHEPAVILVLDALRAAFPKVPAEKK